MVTVLVVLVVISMIATLSVLFAGMIGIARSNPDPLRSNRLMQWRVALQGVTLVLFAALLYALRG